jgi:hypothetical protein
MLTVGFSSQHCKLGYVVACMADETLESRIWHQIGRLKMAAQRTLEPDREKVCICSYSASTADAPLAFDQWHLKSNPQHI